MILENKLHEMARSFMAVVATEDMELLSLDEFLIEYKSELTEDQLKLGWEISNMFDEI